MSAAWCLLLQLHETLIPNAQRRTQHLVEQLGISLLLTATGQKAEPWIHGLLDTEPPGSPRIATHPRVSALCSLFLTCRQLGRSRCSAVSTHPLTSWCCLCAPASWEPSFLLAVTNVVCEVGNHKKMLQDVPFLSCSCSTACLPPSCKTKIVACFWDCCEEGIGSECFAAAGYQLWTDSQRNPYSPFSFLLSAFSYKDANHHYLH